MRVDHHACQRATTTAVTEGDLSGGSAIGGPAGSAVIFGNAVFKTGSTVLP